MSKITATEEIIDGARKEVFAFAQHFAIYGHAPSRFCEGAELETLIGWGCPRCKTGNLVPLEHGQEDVCCKCGLHVQLRGNGLLCWE